MNTEVSKAFQHLVATDTPDAIYYADLFKINGKAWMIMGYGKSVAARLATNKDPLLDIARDAVAIIRKENALFGRYDPGAHKPSDPTLNALHELHAIVYCLNEEQTIAAYDDVGDTRGIANAGAEIIGMLCATYKYPAYLASEFFCEQDIMYFSNPRRMMAKFNELSKDVMQIKFLLVPHMPTVEEKADLYIRCNLDSI